jgi:beta-galactosidase
LKAGAEYHLKVIFKTSKDNPWSKKGHIVAWEQFKLPFKTTALPEADISNYEKLTVSENSSGVAISGNGFDVLINKSDGLLSSYKLDGKECGQ